MIRIDQFLYNGVEARGQRRVWDARRGPKCLELVREGWLFTCITRAEHYTPLAVLRHVHRHAAKHHYVPRLRAVLKHAAQHVSTKFNVKADLIAHEMPPKLRHDHIHTLHTILNRLPPLTLFFHLLCLQSSFDQSCAQSPWRLESFSTIDDIDEKRRAEGDERSEM